MAVGEVAQLGADGSRAERDLKNVTASIQAKEREVAEWDGEGERARVEASAKAARLELAGVDDDVERLTRRISLLEAQALLEVSAPEPLRPPGRWGR